MPGLKLIAIFLVCLLFTVAVPAAKLAAQGPTRGPVEATRDAEMEIKAKHNLETARWYLTKRKAYQGALDRLQEIMDGYPEFSRIDEVVFWMGEANLKLKKNDKAEELFGKLLKAYPSSEFAKKARERLDELKAEPEKK
ncbi:MAG TPA: outer membrane protein assembly factor BamD [Blastocatellia bacterium]|nr:outer membrane protein assembly factor BamD [Blastocatellia bacterium]